MMVFYNVKNMYIRYFFQYRITDCEIMSINCFVCSFYLNCLFFLQWFGRCDICFVLYLSKANAVQHLKSQSHKLKVSFFGIFYVSNDIFRIIKVCFIYWKNLYLKNILKEKLGSFLILKYLLQTNMHFKFYMEWHLLFIARGIPKLN